MRFAPFLILAMLAGCGSKPLPPDWQANAKGSLDEFIDPLRPWIDEGRLRPIVAEAFPLERGGDAHRFIIERRNVGKVVLTLD